MAFYIGQSCCLKLWAGIMRLWAPKLKMKCTSIGSRVLRRARATLTPIPSLTIYPPLIMLSPLYINDRQHLEGYHNYHQLPSWGWHVVTTLATCALEPLSRRLVTAIWLPTTSLTLACVFYIATAFLGSIATFSRSTTTFSRWGLTSRHRVRQVSNVSQHWARSAKPLRPKPCMTPTHLLQNMKWRRLFMIIYVSRTCILDCLLDFFNLLPTARPDFADLYTKPVSKFVTSSCKSPPRKSGRHLEKAVPPATLLLHSDSCVCALL